MVLAPRAGAENAARQSEPPHHPTFRTEHEKKLQYSTFCDAQNYVAVGVEVGLEALVVDSDASPRGIFTRTR